MEQWNAEKSPRVHCSTKRPVDLINFRRHHHCPSSRSYRLIAPPSPSIVYSPSLSFIRSPPSYPINNTAPRPQHHFSIIRSVMEEEDQHWRKMFFWEGRAGTGRTLNCVLYLALLLALTTKPPLHTSTYHPTPLR